MQKITGKTMPDKKAATGRKLVYPFNTLEVGECLELSEKENKNKAKRISVINSAYQYGRNHKKAFAVRTENNITGIWRVK